jgi:hypothetical protein
LQICGSYPTSLIPRDFALAYPESGGMMSPFVRIDKPVGVPAMKAVIRRF